MKPTRASWFFLLVYVYCTFSGIVLAQGALSEPIAIRVGESVLDVEHEGQAAPAVMDVDGDGIRDLLVGGAYKGLLRIYRNQASNGSPQFANYTFFQDGILEGRVPEQYGFCPNAIDIDRDGLMDVITPAWHGQVHWFRQTSPGSFAKGTPLKNASGKSINAEWTYGATACDWDSDGFPDVVFSQEDRNKNGNLYLLRNTAKDHEPRFENPVPIMKGETVLYVNTRAPAPAAADWNGDGLFDLLIGTSEGSVLLYLNIGERGKPKFAEVTVLISIPEGGNERGGNARPCVVDWNGDGRLDILLGDTGKRFDRRLSGAELAAKTEAKQLQESAFSRWSQTYRLYRQLKQAAPESRNEQAVESVRNQMIKLTREQDLLSLQLESYIESQQTHGRVWLFLGQ